MNIYQSTGIILQISALLLSGCCKKNNSDLPATSYKMSATLQNPAGNTIFRAVGPSYVTAVKKDSTLTISGIDTAGGSPVTLFLFKIKHFNGARQYLYTYDVTSDSKAYFETTAPSFSQTSFAWAYVRINSQPNEMISGTFFGTLMDSTHITDGTFTASPAGF